MRTPWSLLALAGVVVACSSSSGGSGSTDGGKPQIHASDYDQSCGTDSDCIGVQDGDACCLPCITAAINVKDQAKFDADANTLHAACGNQVCPAVDCSAPGQPTCSGGRCTLAPRTSLDAGPSGDASPE
jgi:hypothetical protein